MYTHAPRDLVHIAHTTKGACGPFWLLRALAWVLRHLYFASPLLGGHFTLVRLRGSDPRAARARERDTQSQRETEKGDYFIDYTENERLPQKHYT